jgi:mannan endo-1,4-beta-mannosidase
MRIETKGSPLLRLMVSAALVAMATGVSADPVWSKGNGFLPVQAIANAHLNVGHKEKEHHRRHHGANSKHTTKPSEDSTKDHENHPIAVTGVTLPQATTLNIGATTSLVATIQPANATNKAITWSTSDAKIATVAADGKVTAVAAGTTIITATTADGALTSSCTITVPAPAANIGIHVSGTEVDERDGKPFLMRGINVADAWFADKTTGSLADIARTGANTVRIVLASGDRWTMTSEATVASLIAQAKANKLIAILEVHDTTGYGEQAGAITLAKAVDYWKSIKGALIGQEDYVIIDIGNEPLGNGQPASAWINGHIDAIKSLRDAGFNHALMVDAPDWGQDWENIARDNAAAVLAADPQKNVIFDVHMYQVYAQAAAVDTYMSAFKKNNLALVVGEFAADHQGADVDEAAVMSYAKQYSYGYLGWSWSGNSAGLESLDVVQNFNAGTLTPWGNTLINGANGIKATSALASIYGGGSVATTVRVMPLGDSITGSPGCWRKTLWTSLADNTKVDMVGVRNNESECGTGWDADNAAFGGMRVTNVGADVGLAGASRTSTVTVAPNVTAVPGNLEVWLEQTRPDLVTMNLGTNDIWSGVPADTILAGYDKLLAQMRASNSRMRVMVAKIGKFDPRDSSGNATCANCATAAAAFNTALDAWAQCASSVDSPITVVDIASQWNPATMTDDGVHPNALGTTTMASIWKPALEATLAGINTPGPGPAPTCQPIVPATDATDGATITAGNVATTVLSSFRTGVGALQVYKTDGNTDATLAAISMDRPSGFATEGNTAAKVVLATNADAMVGATPSVADWSKARTLKVDMAATGGIYWTQLVTKSGTAWNWCTLGQSSSIAPNTSTTVTFDLTAQTCYGATKTIDDFVSNDVKLYYLLVQSTSGTYYIDNIRLE